MSPQSELLIAASATARPVRIVKAGAALEGRIAAWAEANGFTGKTGQLLVVPTADGAPEQALFGAGEAFEPMTARGPPAPATRPHSATVRDDQKRPEPTSHCCQVPLTTTPFQYGS